MSKEEIIQKHLKWHFDIVGGEEEKGFPYLLPSKVNEALDEYAKQDGVQLLKWLLTPNEEMTITSGDNVWYVNGEETSHEKLYELYTQSKTQ